jgi:hypothetical protein
MPWCQQCGQPVEDDDLVAGPPGVVAASPGAVAPSPGSEGTEAASSDSEVRDRCPRCGTVLEVEEGADDEEAHLKAPWHFKVLVVGTVVYLGYRLYQGIGWLIHHA